MLCFIRDSLVMVYLHRNKTVIKTCIYCSCCINELRMNHFKLKQSIYWSILYVHSVAFSLARRKMAPRSPSIQGAGIPTPLGPSAVAPAELLFHGRTILGLQWSFFVILSSQVWWLRKTYEGQRTRSNQFWWCRRLEFCSGVWTGWSISFTFPGPWLLLTTDFCPQPRHHKQLS